MSDYDSTCPFTNGASYLTLYDLAQAGSGPKWLTPQLVSDLRMPSSVAKLVKRLNAVMSEKLEKRTKELWSHYFDLLDSTETSEGATCAARLKKLSRGAFDVVADIATDTEHTKEVAQESKPLKPSGLIDGPAIRGIVATLNSIGQLPQIQGLKYTVLRSTYAHDCSHGELKIRVAFAGAVTPEEKSFRVHAPLRGISASYFGQVFTMGRGRGAGTFKITGWNTRSRTRPVMCVQQTAVRSQKHVGRTWRFSVDTIKRMLKIP